MTPAPDPTLLRRIAPIMYNAGRDPAPPKGGYQTLFALPKYGYCEICTTPVSVQYLRCRSCRDYAPEVLPDAMVFLTYGVQGQQSGVDARHYKDAPGGPSAGSDSAQRLQILLRLFREHHGSCLFAAVGYAQDRFRIATVPSGKGRSEHPLESMLLPHLAGPIPAEVERIAPPRPGSMRETGVVATRYVVYSDVTDCHVILLDDTWTTGSQALSTAAALRNAGATRISLICVSRSLNPSWDPTGPWLKDHKPLPHYDPSFCPVTRSFQCPS